MSNMYDVIVVGAGVVGSSTGYQLAKQGYKTLLIEQFSLGHSRGSSHGHSRITRKAYEQDFYAEMMGEAFDSWETLEAEQKEQLFVKCGLLNIGKSGCSLIEGTKHSLTKINCTHECMTADEINKRYPTIHVDDCHVGVYEPNAGVLKADKCLKALQGQFVHYGGCLLEEEPVLSIRPGHPVTVNTSKDSYQAKSVIITVGPWADKVLKPLGLHLPLQPERINVFYWKQKVCGHDPQNYPTVIMQGLMPGKGDDIYSLPALEYPEHVKMAVHGGPVIDPDHRDAVPQDSDDEQTLSCLIKKHFPCLEDKPSIKETCIYTVTPDSNFVLDTHPYWKNIVIGAGFSGHGFKLGPVVGKILGQLANGQTPNYDLTPFRIDRFQQSELKANL